MKWKIPTPKPLPRQPELNIGTAGHVDHGKTTLVQALTGLWTARHSEELKRGVSIRIGYADVAVYKCPSCEPPDCYTVHSTCLHCGSETEFQRAISFVDCPGHEVLMTTMLAGASVMDGAILVIAADEPVPQPQTREHLAALEVIGVKDIAIVQNKVDIVPRESAIENYKQIVGFARDRVIEKSPIIPVSAQHAVNLDLLIEAIEKTLPTPRRDLSRPPRMFVVRSFDVNKPGTPADKLVGGVIGGTILQGKFRIGDEIEIRPGVKVEGGYQELCTEIVGLVAGGRQVGEAACGGLVGIGTKLDPSLTKADGLLGNVAGKPGTLPPVVDMLALDVRLFEYVVGLKEMVRVESISVKEPLVLNVGTAVTLGAVTSIQGDIAEIRLRKPVCAEEGQRVAISRRVAERWRLIGYGIVC